MQLCEERRREDRVLLVRSAERRHTCQVQYIIVYGIAPSKRLMKRCEVGRVYVCMLHGNGSEEVESAAFWDEALYSHAGDG